MLTPETLQQANKLFLIIAKLTLQQKGIFANYSGTAKTRAAISFSVSLALKKSTSFS